MSSDMKAIVFLVTFTISVVGALEGLAIWKGFDGYCFGLVLTAIGASSALGIRKVVEIRKRRRKQ